MLNIKDQSQGHQRGGGAGKGPIGQTDKQTITNSELSLMHVISKLHQHRQFHLLHSLPPPLPSLPRNHFLQLIFELPWHYPLIARSGEK